MSPITFNRSKNFDEIKTFFTLTVKMQNISDLSFHEFGNSEAFEEETDLNEDYSRKTVRVNIHGQKVPGANLEFLSPKEYFESQLFIELKEMFSRKRKNDDLCHGDVHHYVCKYSRAGKRNIFLVLIK